MARPHWWDCPLESLTHLVITWDIKDHVSKSLNQGVAHCVKRALFIMWLIKVTKVKAHLGWQDPNTKCEAQFSEEHHLGESSRQDTQLYVCILKEKGQAVWEKRKGGHRHQIWTTIIEQRWRQLAPAPFITSWNPCSHLEPCDLNKSHDRGRGLRTLASDRRVMTHT